MNNIDPRLAALYNEYLVNGKEYEFINMLYAILDMVALDIRQKVYRARAAWKRKITFAERKALKTKVEMFFSSLTPEELIKYQNTPWNELPDWLKEALPKIVQHPEECNFVRIYDLVHKSDRQKEIAASRITRYMENHGLITSNEEGTTLHYDKFSEICNEQAVKYDLPWAPGKKPQRTRITVRDLKNYTQCRVTPKPDKMAVLAAVTDLPVWYLAGYGDVKEPPKVRGNLLSAKYKKPRNSSNDAA